MPLENTTSHYGGLTKTFHWLTALLILTALPLGVIAQQLPFETNEQLALKATVFSAHKTVGVLAFTTALLRILWAMTQKRPALLNADHKAEALAAETAHWLLYGSMLLVPLTGWIHHAATEGFAPILLPIGQNLPFVPESERLAEVTAGLHYVLVIVMGATILAHVGGALKHFIIDKDQTLQRMIPGTPKLPELGPHSSHLRPLALALLIWAGAMAAGTFGGVFAPSHTHSQVAELEAVPSDWTVTEGQLRLQITQFGNPVVGQFDEWTAQISFEEDATDGSHGHAKVEIAIGSLALGSVTQQAMGFDFFNLTDFPTALFEADIQPVPGGDERYLAVGTLTLKGQSIPVGLPFQLLLENGVATMSGSTALDRLDFGIGANMPDESNLGFGVQVNISLTAARAAANTE